MFCCLRARILIFLNLSRCPSLYALPAGVPARGFALALDLEPDFFDPIFSEPMSRLNSTIIRHRTRRRRERDRRGAALRVQEKGSVISHAQDRL